jgi:hypothetical protein
MSEAGPHLATAYPDGKWPGNKAFGEAPSRFVLALAAKHR